MAEQQMHLFEPARPLLTRFGADFFRAVPARPGVYIMGGEAGCVLYIGQSGNLRHRLGSYKNARPDRAPRKVIRLVHAVRSIVWEECESPVAARLKENQLLRRHRPRFNSMNTWPQRHRFIALQADDQQIALSLSAEPGGAGNVYGAFKGCAPAFGALLRMLWTALHRPESLSEFPHRLLAGDPPREFVLRLCDNDTNWPVWLDAFLTGTSDELLQRLNDALPVVDSLPTFQKNLQTTDLALLTDFFERGPRKNRELRYEYGLDRGIILQEELDDWLLPIAGKNGQV